MNINPLFKLIPKNIRDELDLITTIFKNSEILDSNSALKDKYLGQACFILTNGPSLREHDLVRLRNQQTFAINFFCLHPQYRKIKPKFYLALDPVIFTRQLLFKHFYPYIEKANLTGTRFFFPLSTKSTIDKRKLFPDNQIHYLVGRSTPKSDPARFDLASSSQFIDSSPAFVLLLAHYMGFRKIYILGSDFRDFLKGESHFYPNFRRSENEPFLLNNQSVANRAIIMAEILNRFKVIGDFLKTKGTKIYNATPGFLDVFPLVNYEKIKLDE